MRISITGAAIAALLLASPAAAQEAAPRPEIVEAATALMDRFAVLLDDLGVEGAALPREPFIRAVAAALPIGATEGDISWASGVNFNAVTTVSAGELAPDEAGRTVITDARACLRDGAGGEVVHFERIARDGLIGHRCVVVSKSVPDNVWVLQSDTFAEGPGRRFTAHYAMGVAVKDNPDLVRRMLDERLDANIRLSGAMALEGLDLFLLRPRDGGPVPPAEAEAGLAELGAQLTAVGEGQ